MNDEISYEKGAQVLFSKLYTSHSIIVQRKKKVIIYFEMLVKLAYFLPLA